MKQQNFWTKFAILPTLLFSKLRILQSSALVCRFFGFDFNPILFGKFILTNSRYLPRNFRQRFVGFDFEPIAVDFFGDHRLRELSDDRQLIISGGGIEKDKSGNFVLAIYLNNSAPETLNLPAEFENYPIKYIQQDKGFRKFSAKNDK